MDDISRELSPAVGTYIEYSTDFAQDKPHRRPSRDSAARGNGRLAGYRRCQSSTDVRDNCDDKFFGGQCCAFVAVGSQRVCFPMPAVPGRESCRVTWAFPVSAHRALRGLRLLSRSLLGCPYPCRPARSVVPVAIAACRAKGAAAITAGKWPDTLTHRRVSCAHDRAAATEARRGCRAQSTQVPQTDTAGAAGATPPGPPPPRRRRRAHQTPAAAPRRHLPPDPHHAGGRTHGHGWQRGGAGEARAATAAERRPAARARRRPMPAKANAAPGGRPSGERRGREGWRRRGVRGAQVEKVRGPGGWEEESCSVGRRG